MLVESGAFVKVEFVARADWNNGFEGEVLPEAAPTMLVLGSLLLEVACAGEKSPPFDAGLDAGFPKEKAEAGFSACEVDCPNEGPGAGLFVAVLFSTLFSEAEAGVVELPRLNSGFAVGVVPTFPKSPANGFLGGSEAESACFSGDTLRSEVDAVCWKLNNGAFGVSALAVTAPSVGL